MRFLSLILLSSLFRLKAVDVADITADGTPSQTTSHSSGNYPATNSVDGDPFTTNHTDSGGMGGALILDFPEDRLISKVEILTRDCCGGRLNGATLRLFNLAGNLMHETDVRGRWTCHYFHRRNIDTVPC